METAVTEYRVGRAELQRYVERLPRTNGHFSLALAALSHFEQSVAALYQAATLLKSLVNGPPLFASNDGSVMDRLNKIYNRSKHFEEGPGSIAPPPAPVWLTNDGLECSNAAVTFSELRDLILDFTRGAEAITQKWSAYAEKHRADQPKESKE